jgi:hypothetical protein
MTAIGLPAGWREMRYVIVAGKRADPNAKG